MLRSSPLGKRRELNSVGGNANSLGVIRQGGKRVTGLHSLDLSGTQVTDAGLEHLKGRGDLRELNLPGTQVTDAGLEHRVLPASVYESF